MLFNEILSARFNRLLQAFLPLDEQHGVVTAAPEVQVGFTLESERPEWEFIKGEVLRSCGVRQAADAANQSGVYLHNSAGRVIVVVEQIHVGVNAAATIQVQISQGITTFTATSEWARDTRWALTQGHAQVTFTSGAIAAAGTAGCLYQGVAAANTSLVIPGPIILTPSSQLVVNTTANNIQLDVTYFWRERVAQPAELP